MENPLTDLAKEGTKREKILLSSQNGRFLLSIDYHASDCTITELQKPCNLGLEILGSCNGIVLLGLTSTFYLWNPSAGEFQNFSFPSTGEGLCKFGLGYDSSSDNYKVVRFFRGIEAYDPISVHVFSSRTNSWKRVQDFAYKFYEDAPGIVLNGSPHWVANSGSGSLLVKEIINVIVYFDALEEKFKEIPQPKYGGNSKMLDLAVLGGWLCVVHSPNDAVVDVWAMKDYGVKESWTKLFVVQHVSGEFCFHYFVPICFISDDEVVMVLNSQKLVIYNIKNKNFRRIRVPENCNSALQAITYIESLGSPGGNNTTVKCS